MCFQKQLNQVRKFCQSNITSSLKKKKVWISGIIASNRCIDRSQNTKKEWAWSPFQRESPGDNRHVLRETHGKQHLWPENPRVPHFHPLLQPCVFPETQTWGVKTPSCTKGHTGSLLEWKRDTFFFLNRVWFFPPTFAMLCKYHTIRVNNGSLYHEWLYSII